MKYKIEIPKYVLASKCEIRAGIGLCDECSLPKWPQEYVGNGCMVCLDCLAGFQNVELQKSQNQYSGGFC